MRSIAVARTRGMHAAGPTGILAAGAACGVTALEEFRDQRVPMLALDFNRTLAHGSARTAALLEFLGQRRERRRTQRQARDDRYCFAAATLGRARDAHHTAPGASRLAARILAGALGHGTTAAWTNAADVALVNNAQGSIAGSLMVCES